MAADKTDIGYTVSIQSKNRGNHTMEAFSISFTLGKASSPHGANLRHNNRKFYAPNIDPSRTEQNMTYVRQDVREAYHQLFDRAVEDYNANQKPDSLKEKFRGHELLQNLEKFPSFGHASQNQNLHL